MIVNHIQRKNNVNLLNIKATGSNANIIMDALYLNIISKPTKDSIKAEYCCFFCFFFFIVAPLWHACDYDDIIILTCS